MPLPTRNDVRPVDPVLTDMSIGFKNDRFLWDKIAPSKESTEQSGTYFIYTRDYWFRRGTRAERAATAPYERVDYGVATDTFKAAEYGFEKALSDVVKNASQTPESLEVRDNQFLTNLIQLELEIQVAAAAFITGVWGTSTNPTTQWSDFDNSDPITDIEVGKRTIRRNTGSVDGLVLFIGALCWESLKEHPLLLDKYKYTQKGILTEELVAAALGVGEIVVGDSVQNTAAEGQTYVGADIWTDNALLLIRNNPGLLVPNGATTFVWNERGNVPWAAETYREEPIRSDVQRVFSHWDVEIVSAQHGYMLLDCVA